MSDSYQAIYDAVRSRIGGGNVAEAVESALRDAFSRADQLLISVAENYTEAAYEQMRPSVLYRPALSVDGDWWCALYGDDLQSGIAGFGETPATAMKDFDKQWTSSMAVNKKEPA